MQNLSTKEKLLHLLESFRPDGEFVSGEALAQKLGISRAAVSKAVAQLRAQGLGVDSLAGCGYRITGDAEFLSEQSILRHLPGHCAPIKIFDTLPSTNTTAKQWAQEGAPHASLLVAKSQSGGRGRMGRQFSSPKGGLYFSIILRPELSLADASLLTCAAAVAVCRTASQLCGLSLGIKWVNDVYLGGKKCCGILTEAESSLENSFAQHVVVGIGINYTTIPESFAPEHRDIATSLYPGKAPPASPSQLIAGVYTQLLSLCALLPGTAFLAEYKERSLAIGRTVRVMASPPYDALALDIDSAARLVVQKQDGSTTALSSGEISILL